MLSLYLTLTFFLLSAIVLPAQQNALGIPGRIDFGMVPVGSSRDTSIVLRNQMDSTIIVSYLGASGPDSSNFVHDLDTVKTVFPRTTSDSLRVTFTPTRSGIFFDTLRVSLDKGSTVTSIVLQGRAPRLSLIPNPVVMGPIRPGQCTTIIVSLRNNDSSPVRVNSVDLDDPRFSALFTDSTIEPLGSIQFPVTFCPNDTDVNIYRAVLTAHLAGATETFPVQGEARYPFTLSPSVVDFGSVQYDSCRRRDVLITNTSGKGISLDLGLRMMVPGLSLSPDTVVLATDESKVITLIFCASDRAQVVQTDLLFDDIVTFDTSSISVRGHSLPWAFDERVDFGTIQTADSLVRSFQFRYRDSLPPNLVLSIDSTHYFSIVSPQRPQFSVDSTTTIQVRFHPRQDSGCKTGTLSIISGSNSGTILLTGCAIDTGGGGTRGDSINISPTVLNFGDVMIGYCVDTTFRVTNNGSKLVRLDNQLSASDTGYKIISPSDTFTVAPGTSTNITVRYCALTAGTVTALNGLSGPGLTGQNTVQLIGTGIAWSLPSPVIVGPVDLRQGDTCDTASFTLRNSSSHTIRRPTLLLDPPSLNFSVQDSGVATVLPGSTFTITLGYCLFDTASMQTSLRLINPDIPSITFDSTMVIGTRNDTGAVGLRILSVDTTTLDFGPIGIGGFKRDSIRLFNNSGAPVTVTTSLPRAHPVFRPVGGFQVDTIPAQGSLFVVIDFYPQTPGPVTFDWFALLSQPPDSVGVLLRGNGVGREQRVVWLDTTAGQVGDRIPMTLRVSPALGVNEGINNLRFVISYNPESLFLKNVQPLSESSQPPSFTRQFVNDSTVAIEMSNSEQPMVGDSLLALEFIGYTTGEPHNIVLLHRDSLGGFGSLPLAGNGLLLLDGCDLGRGITPSRKVRINSIVSDVGSSEVTIRYRAPHGTLPSLRLIDMNGDRVMENTLPLGNEAEQNARISLTGYAPGIYLIELRAGSDRSVTMIMIGR